MKPIKRLKIFCRDVIIIFALINLVILTLEKRNSRDEDYAYPGILLLALGAFCLLFFLKILRGDRKTRF